MRCSMPSRRNSQWNQCGKEDRGGRDAHSFFFENVGKILRGTLDTTSMKTQRAWSQSLHRSFLVKLQHVLWAGDTRGNHW